MQHKCICIRTCIYIYKYIYILHTHTHIYNIYIYTYLYTYTMAVSWNGEIVFPSSHPSTAGPPGHQADTQQPHQATSLDGCCFQWSVDLRWLKPMKCGFGCKTIWFHMQWEWELAKWGLHLVPILVSANFMRPRIMTQRVWALWNHWMIPSSNSICFYRKTAREKESSFTSLWSNWGGRPRYNFLSLGYFIHFCTQKIDLDIVEIHQPG